MILKHTLSDVPPEMPDAVEGVESERRSQYYLGGIFDRFRKSRDYL